MSRDLSLRHDLLDRQIVDCDRLPVGRVVDLELVVSAEDVSVDALLTGSQALGQRLGGHLGRWMDGVSRQLRDPEAGAGPARIPTGEIDEIGTEVKLARPDEELGDYAPLEHWLRDHFIGRLPGAGHDAG